MEDNYEKQPDYEPGPYNMEDYRPAEQPTPAKRRKRKSHLGLGIFIGLLAGLCGGVLLLYGGLVFFTKATNTVFMISAGKTQTTSSASVLDEATVSKIEEISEYIDLYYDGDVDEEALQDSLLHGLAEGLGDPYTVYYTPEEYAELQVDTTGEYYGIGAGLSQDLTTMVVTVSKVYAGTPAEEAGLMKGDIILYVGDVEATTMELDDLVQLIRGEEGTKVHLQISRDGETLEMDVERRNISLPSVEGQLLEDGMGYIQVSEFLTNTATEFKETFESLEAQGMEGVIIDLRANPGGLLDVVLDMLDYMLPEGKLLSVEDKYGQGETYESDASCKDLPIVILIDGNSASASEIFAGAMKDYQYATLVGTNTFGKGIVQSIFPLSDGDAIKITTMKYFTPNGNYIHGVGIAPDVELEYEWTGPEDATTYEMQYDNQLQKGIEVLREKMAE